MVLLMDGGVRVMFGRREKDAGPKRFWNWFASEAQGYTNALEALARGESDADWVFNALNQRLARIDASLEADVVRTLDGACHLTISGSDSVVHALLAAAPALVGWRISTRAETADRRRVPFRAAPRPSMDSLAQPLSGHHEAWA